MASASDLIVVRTFSKPHEAHLACSALRAAGISATLADEHIVATNWLYSNAVGGVKVLVSAADAVAAEELLALPAEVVPRVARDPAGAAPEREVQPCPRCGSYDVRPVTPGRRLLFLSWLMAGVPLVPVMRRTKCGGCGHRFRAN